MKRIVCMTLAALLVGTTSLTAQGKSKKHQSHEHAASPARSDSHVDVRLVFGSGDVTVIREHYAPRYRNLPPGLQKKVARGGQLPPGWRKKFEPFPPHVERRLAVLPADHRRGVIDGHAVIYNTRSNVIIDVAVLF